MDTQSLSHSRYNCTYHIVFIPKYRRKVMFGDLRKEVGEAISKVCKMEGVTIIKAATLPDHVHMYVSIPPKESVSKVVGRIKGKSSLMLFDRHPEYRDRYNRHFWARGYYCISKNSMRGIDWKENPQSKYNRAAFKRPPVT